MPMATVEPTAAAWRIAPRGKIIAAAVGAVAILGAGVFAVTRIAGDSSSGGASSPEAAANDFLDALDQEDVLGLVDVLLPGERDTFRQPLQDLVGELKRLEVLSSDADLSKIGGIDIAITDRKVDVQATNVDDIVNLEVTATAKATLKGEELPIGAWIRDAIGDQDMSELDETSDAVRGHVPDHRGPQGRALVPQRVLLDRRDDAPRRRRPRHPCRGGRPERRQQPRGGDGQPGQRGRRASTWRR